MKKLISIGNLERKRTKNGQSLPSIPAISAPVEQSFSIAGEMVLPEDAAS